MKIAAVQMRCLEEPYKNIEKAKQMIELASRQEVNLVCMPEIFYLDYSGPFDPGLEVYAEKVPDGPVCSQLSAWAKEYGIAVIAGILEKDATRIYNSCVVFDSDGVFLGKYEKTYIPLAGTSYEKYYFSPGQSDPPVFCIDGIKVGILICYDRHFPELAKVLALKGAQLLVIATGAPDVKGRSNTWRSVLVCRAIENNVYVLGVNRYGEEAHRRCFGQSALVDPWGIVKQEADEGEQLIIGRVDIGETVRARMEFGHFRDIRPDIISHLSRLVQ